MQCFNGMKKDANRAGTREGGSRFSSDQARFSQADGHDLAVTVFQQK
jgi:hypothetical protein